MRLRADHRLWSLMGILLLAAPVLAQQGTSEIRGRVSDPQEASLPGVVVVIRNQDTGMFRQVVSTGDGTYLISGVTPGTYEITAELSGFKKYNRRDVRLEIGKTATLDVGLEMGGVEEKLTVTAEAPLVDITSKEVGGNITSKELLELPSINRNFVGFVGLLPGIVPNISTESFGSDSISANGMDTRNNYYALDGGNNNDDVIGQRAGGQARTSLEAVQEFQVLTSQFDAEFGRTTGAVINAVTKSGTNALKGSLFGYLQDASFTSTDAITKRNQATNPNIRKPDTRFLQWGGTVGGPVIKDKAHFFVSVERVQNDRASTINIPARPELNASPTTQDRVWNTLVRFDHQINRDHTWNVRWLREHSPQLNQIIPLVGNNPVTLDASREEDDLDQTLAASLTSSFGNTRVNTLRVIFTQEDVAFANSNFNQNGQRQDLLEPTLNYLTYSDQQNSVAQARVNNAYQIEDTFNWFIPGKGGDHNVRLGFQYEYVTVHFTDQGNSNGTFTFRNNGPFNQNDFRTYPEQLQVRVPGELTYDQKQHLFGAFIQDKWRVNNRLTLSMGARYDIERIPIPEVNNPRFSDQNDYPVDRNNIAPRLGFAYDLSGDGKTVVRGGYGRFYDRTHFELIAGLLTGGVFSNSFIVTFPGPGQFDPGPSSGQRPTNPFLANGPTVNRNLLNQTYPQGRTNRNAGNINLDNPQRVIPYTDQLSVGFEREVLPDLSISVDYVRAMGHDQFMTLNANPGLRANTLPSGAIQRVDPNFTNAQSVFVPVNTGRINYDAVDVALEKRESHNYRFRISYTFANSRGNTSGNGAPVSNFQLLDDMRLSLNQGPSDFDRRHNFVFSGAARVPKTGGLTVATVVRALSGLAFTIQDQSSDPDRNGILFDPLPSGAYSGTGPNSFSVDNNGGRNGARGPGFLQADVRVGYQFKFGPRHLELFGEVFNLTNRANYAVPSGNRMSTNFLILTALRDGAAPRTGQFGARFVF